MASIRQEKVANLIKQELSLIFQRESRTLCNGAMVSVTVVRMSPDLSFAKVYLSVFGHAKPLEVFENIKAQTGMIRRDLGKTISQQVRKVPELAFFLDDTQDYAETIDKLLKQ